MTKYMKFGAMIATTTVVMLVLMHLNTQLVAGLEANPTPTAATDLASMPTS